LKLDNYLKSSGNECKKKNKLNRKKCIYICMGIDSEVVRLRTCEAKEEWEWMKMKEDSHADRRFP